MKVYLITPIFLLFLNPSIFGQQGIGVKFGLSGGWRFFAEANSDEYRIFRTEKESFLFRPEYQVFYKFPFRHNVDFSIGLGYTEYGYQRKERLIDPGFSPITTGFEDEIFRYRVSYLRIPVYALTMIGENRQIEILGGLSVLQLLKSEFRYIVQRSLFDSQTAIKENWRDPQQTQLSIDVGIGYKFNRETNKGLGIYLESNFLLRRFENTDISGRVYNIGRFVDQDKTSSEHLMKLSLLASYQF